METVAALGVTVQLAGQKISHQTPLDYAVDGDANLEGVVDGCADISVVTIGTLIAFGVEDEPVLKAVDEANLRKFGPGSFVREDGKWMKPPDWTPPDILGVIARQGQ